MDSPSQTMPVLSVEDVSVNFGGVRALQGVSFDIAQGEILGLIGPNGAGKTTLFNCVSRLYRPSAGDIRLLGESVLSCPPHLIAKKGIGRTFQNVALFHNLSVFDNVRVGTQGHTGGDVVSDALRLPWSVRSQSAIDREVEEILSYLGLEDVAYRQASELPFGTQKRVELARALAARPKLLLLDEPAGGLNHEEVYELRDLIRQVSIDRGAAVLVVEHHMGLIMSIADKIVALNFGKKLAEGTPREVQADPGVIEAYLGVPA